MGPSLWHFIVSPALIDWHVLGLVLLGACFCDEDPMVTRLELEAIPPREMVAVHSVCISRPNLLL